MHSNIPMRNNDAKQIKNIRKILKGNMPETLQERPSIVHNAIMVGFCMLLGGLLLICSCKVAHADCSGLTPELQKAYDQLKGQGFDVSCRKV
jgi:hypothetical protein